MSLLPNTNIKGRLKLLVGTSIGLMLLIGIVGIATEQSLNDSLKTVYLDRTVPAADLGEMNRNILEIRLAVTRTLVFRSPASYQEASNNIKTLLEESDKLWTAYLATYLTPEEKLLATQLDSEYKSLRDTGFKVAEKALAEQRIDDIERLITSNQLQSLYAPVREDLHKLTQLQLDIAKQEFDGAQIKATQSIIASIALLLIAAGITIALAYSIISGIGRAVKSIDTTTQALGQGNLIARVSYNGNDELGNISRSINSMADSFRHTVSEVMSSAQQIASAAEEMSAISEQTSNGIFRQQSETDQVATAMNEMSATVQEVAHSAAQTASATQQANEQAVQSKRVVNDNIHAIRSLAQEVETATRVIEDLAEQSTSIGSVLDVIRGIAEQTNLLALNAAIEAARAGEQGRGFAVVADEVRTLASRTQESTQEIQKMIEGLQAGSKSAVQVMEKGRGQAQSSVQQSSRAGEALDVIAEAINKITDMSTQIASAAEEQSAVAEEINRNIVNISQIGNETSSGARSTADASLELERPCEISPGASRYKLSSGVLTTPRSLPRPMGLV